MDAMKSTIRKFLDIAAALSAERNFARLLDRVRETIGASGAAPEWSIVSDDGHTLDAQPRTRRRVRRRHCRCHCPTQRLRSIRPPGLGGAATGVTGRGNREIAACAVRPLSTISRAARRP
jgi:hypothetical protein